MDACLERFRRDLEIRNYSPRTVTTYVAQARRFARFLGKPLEEATLDDIQRYQLHLTREKKVSWCIFNQSVCALRHLFCGTLETGWEVRHIPYQKTGRRLPEVLARQVVLALLLSITNLKHRTFFSTVYDTGLRLGEALGLRVSDIDSARMVIRVEQGKRRKDRYVVLSRRLLVLLREYWVAYRPADLLFPGKDPERPLNPSTLQRVIKRRAREAGIRKRVTCHTLRHCFATHLLEQGVSIRVVQRLLGHEDMRTTMRYLHVASNYLVETRSPLDLALSELQDPLPPLL